MNDILGKQIKDLFLDHATQLFLNEALCYSCAKGLVLGEKYGAISNQQFISYSAEIEKFRGLYDIVDWIRVLKLKYDYLDTNDRGCVGPITSLVFVTVKRATRVSLTKKSKLIIDDFSYLIREFNNLFFMLKSFRDYYQHNPVKDDVGLNTIVLSSIIRVLDRATFHSLEKAEERENLKKEAQELLLQFLSLSSSKSEDILQAPETQPIVKLEFDDKTKSDKIGDFGEKIIEKIEQIANDQTSMRLAIQDVLDSQRQLRSRTSNALESESILQGAEANSRLNDSHDFHASTGSVAQETQESDTTVQFDRIPKNEDEIPVQELDYEETSPPTELLTPDVLRTELMKLRQKIVEEFSRDNWKGMSSNLLQRQIINVILYHEPESIDELLQIPDVQWRYKKAREAMDIQLERFGSELNNLFQNTAWRRVQ